MDEPRVGRVRRELNFGAVAGVHGAGARRGVSWPDVLTYRLNASGRGNCRPRPGGPRLTESDAIPLLPGAGARAGAWADERGRRSALANCRACRIVTHMPASVFSFPTTIVFGPGV